MEKEVSYTKERITNLDFIRGFALLGILVMNVIAFGLPLTATTNPSTYGIDNILDWIVLVVSSVFFEYKMMGLFFNAFWCWHNDIFRECKEKNLKTQNTCYLEELSVTLFWFTSLLNMDR